MAISHSTLRHAIAERIPGARLIRAVAYYRMSSDAQEASIPEQREAVRKYAEQHGYTIVREYTDEGISGDDTKHRLQFQAMHKAACNGRDFDVILVWDQDRFGRFDSLESGYWVHPLRQAGVKLCTVNEGIVNWDDFTGRVMHSIKAEGKHQFLHDLSRNTLRGKLTAAKQGFWLGRAPLGYRAVETDPSRPGKRKRLVPGDPRDVAVVQRIFVLYLEGLSVREIAHQLTRETGGKPARSPTKVSEVLHDDTYIGTYRWNGERRGKYHSVSSGEVAKAGQRGATPEADWIVIENNHPALIDRETFARAQTAMAARQRSTTPHKRGGGFLLTGICRCGKCGSAMAGHAGYGVTRYVCLRHERTGECDRNAVVQSELLDNIVTVLQTKVLEPRNVERIKAELRKQVAAKTAAADPAELERQLAMVTAKLDKAKRRLIEVDRDLLDVVQDEVRRLRDEQEQLEAAVKAVRTPEPAIFTDMVHKLDAAIARLSELRAVVLEGYPVKVREYLREAIARVDVRTSREQRGKRSRYRLAGGSIYLRGLELPKLFATSCG